MPKSTAARSKRAPLPPELAAIAKTVIEAELPNGLKVRLVPNPSVPNCSYYTFFRVGARNERPGITGISHLFEHMMFNGAKKYGPGQFDKVLESNGGTSNAYTSNDLTVYYEDFMAEALETVIDLESDRMRSLAVTPKMLASERQVVMEERRLRVDNEIAGMMDEELGALVYKAHPYRWPVIGWMGDIENISREDCLEYFRTYYAPNNATIFIAGDFDPKQALALIKKAYGSIKAGPPVPGVLDAEPEQKGERRAELHHPAQAPSVLVAWRGPRGDDPDTLALDVVQYALSVGQSSRLHKRFVYDLELAVGVNVDWTWRFDPGSFTVAIELKADGKAADAEKFLMEELEKLERDGLEARELEKAKNNLAATLLRELTTNSGRAHALGTYELMMGDWRRGLALPATYEQVTSDDVKRVVKKYLTKARRNVVTLVPTEEGQA